MARENRTSSAVRSECVFLQCAVRYEVRAVGLRGRRDCAVIVQSGGRAVGF